ncbi:MAG: amidohydrolase family protein [Candidatus Glassbacteria bacterium]|nr:amidohydrolase family protein [Candidatus Glassbacteria bacterium]
MAETKLFGAYDGVEVEDTLLLRDFTPRTVLVQQTHIPDKPAYPAVDAHVHLDETGERDVSFYLRLMDEVGLAACVSVQQLWGDELLGYLGRFSGSHPDRFRVVCWIDAGKLSGPGGIPEILEGMKRYKDAGLAGVKFWKDLGLTARTPQGELWRIDDERLDPVWELAGELDLPIVFHTTDPSAFWQPLDGFNERYEELIRHPDWAFNDPARYPPKEEVLAQQEAVIRRHPGTRFWAAHCAARGENLAELTRLLETCPNFYLDTSARINELGRQPWTSRELLVRFADRVAFGSDLLPEAEMYRLCWRFYQTRDEYWDYPSHPSRQGRWKVHSLGLPDETLRKFYHDTARDFYWKA